jgi:hypothetical protein
MAKSKKIPWQCRQGDVFVERVDGAPSGSEVPREGTRIVLAHGEATGHAHVVDRRDAALYEVEDRTEVGDRIWNRLLRALGGATLKHDCPGQAQPDHESIQLPPGEYEVIQQLTYSPAEIVPVRD